LLTQRNEDVVIADVWKLYLVITIIIMFRQWWPKRSAL